MVAFQVLADDDVPSSLNMSHAPSNGNARPVKRPIVLPRSNSTQASREVNTIAPEAGPSNLSRPSISPTTSRNSVPQIGRVSSESSRSGTPVATATTPAPPVQRPVVVHPSTNTIVINPCQKGNPIINHIRNIAYEWGDIVSDYQVGATTGVLFLS